MGGPVPGRKARRSRSDLTPQPNSPLISRPVRLRAPRPQVLQGTWNTSLGRLAHAAAESDFFEITIETFRPFGIVWLLRGRPPPSLPAWD
jgi:hypothetical protein